MWWKVTSLAYPGTFHSTSWGGELSWEQARQSPAALGRLVYASPSLDTSSYESLQSLQKKLSSPPPGWREWSSESWSSSTVRPRKAGAVCGQKGQVLKDANADVANWNSLGVWQPWCSLSPTVACWEHPPFWGIFQSLFSPSWLTHVKSFTLWSVLLAS